MAAAPTPTHYDTLKVARDAPLEVIRAAYRSLSLMYHPDRNRGDDAAARMTAINAAYAVLSNAVKKSEHDRWIAQQEARAAPQERRVEHPGPGAGTGKTKPSVAASPSAPLKRKRWRRLVLGLTSVAAFAALFGMNIPFGGRDVWLEQAWQQSWRGMQPTPAALADPPRVVRAYVAPEPPYYERLKLDTSLTSGATPTR